jgi:hypothetical protein
VPGACVDEDIALRVGGDTGDFAEIKAAGQLNRARNGIELDPGCSVLGESEGREHSGSKCDGQGIQGDVHNGLLVTVLRGCPLVS